MLPHKYPTRVIVALVTMFAAGVAQADLVGPSGGEIDPGADFVDNGFFGTFGGVTPLAIDDGMGQLETAVEVAAPVEFVEPEMGGGPLFFFPEIQFGGDGELPQITEETSVQVTTTLNLQNSDPFNIWTADIFADSVDYHDGSGLQDENTAAWLDTGIEVTFDGTPVDNLNTILSNDDTSLLLAFDEVSGTGEFTVTMSYQSLAELPVMNPEGSGSPPGGMSFNFIEMNASSGDTTPGLWNIDAVGFWTSPASWGPGGAPNTSFRAQFGDVITQDRTVVVNENVATAGVSFDNANRYVLAGPGTVMVESDSAASMIESLQGQHEFQAQVDLGNDAEIVTASASDSIDFNNTVAFNGNTATVSGSGWVNFNNKAQVTPSALVGDYNENNTVDAADYTIWRDTLGADGSILSNRDPELTGVVGEDDYLAWEENFGTTTAGGTGGMLINQGNVGGSGRVAASLVNEMGGIVGPGRSAGTLLVDGNFSQDDLSTLLIELGGTAAGEFDLLDIGGTAMLDGQLEISLIDSFAPADSNSFDVLTAASITDNGLTLSGNSSGFGFAIVSGGNGQVLQLQFSAGAGASASVATVPEPMSLMLSLAGCAAVSVFRRKRSLAKKVLGSRHLASAAGIVAFACLIVLLLTARAAIAQPTLIDFSTNLLPDMEVEGVMPGQMDIEVAGLSTNDSELNVISFSPAGGSEMFMFIPARDGEESVYPDHTAGPGDPGDNPLVFSGGDHSALLFEDPGFPTFGVEDPLKVSSVWVGRTIFGSTSGDIVGLFDNTEKWRVPVSTGTLLPADEEDPLELTYVEIFTPHGTGDEINELQFEGDFPAIDDITIGLSGLPATPTGSLDWIAGSYGLANGVGAWAPSSLPDNSTDLSFSSPDRENLIVTDGGLTAKSMSFETPGQTLFLGSGTVTLDADTDDPTIDVLSGSGNVEFQAPVNLVDNLTIDAATGSSVVFNNIIDLGGNDLTISSNSDVIFNNQVILSGGSIVGPFGLGSGGLLVAAVPEPTTLTLVIIVCTAAFAGTRRRRP